MNWVEYDTRQERDLEPAEEPEDKRPIAVSAVGHATRSALPPEDEYERRVAPLSHGVLARLLVVLIIVAGMVYRRRDGGDDILAMVREF